MKNGILREIKELEEKFNYENNLMIPHNQQLITELINKIKELQKRIKKLETN